MKYIFIQINKLPKLIRFLLISVSVCLLVFVVMRVVFWRVFNNPDDVIPYSILLKSFYVGLKFDLRLALLINLPVLILAWIKPVNIFSTTFGRRLWGGYLIAANSIVLLFYFVDFGYYAYLQSRMDATILRFLYNPQVSLQMVLESYSVLWSAIILALLMLAYAIVVNRIILRVKRTEAPALGKWKKIVAVSLSAFIYLFGIYGKLSYYPLRWSDAFFSNYYFASAVSLNPVLNFFDTFKNKNVSYDEAEVKKYYDTVATYLGVTDRDKDGLNFTRINGKAGGHLDRPNVVMVFLESFAFYKTGVSGNPLDPTPNFDAMTKDSLLFTRFYTPHPGTARSVFAAVTGIPDIELIKTSSRNPLIVRQHTIINAFEGYEKFYFLGGSASWGEIRGLLSHNMPGLHIFEEGSYSAPRVDVWGISDLHLFEEANRVLRETRDNPFFAIIQTSGNHRPYTIPDDSRGFQPLSPDKDDVTKYGFMSVDEFNAFRFLDHSVGFFLETAKRQDYFNNTIFVFFGDHGLPRHASHMHKSEDRLMLGKYHVPLAIYAPGLIRGGKVYHKMASEVDLLPTIAGLASIPYVNSTFGRDLLDDRFDARRHAFTIVTKGGVEIGVISNKFYFLTNADGSNKRLHEIYSDTPRKNLIDKFPQIAAELERICRGIYETARYIRYHNSPEMVAAKANSTFTSAGKHPSVTDEL
ncbi:MAG: sulfatase-like hydrolase/transferase [Desulfobacterales bacterium]|nr:sulfatase-like hydrolase/transferase [Desulfobacterales bacterium]